MCSPMLYIVIKLNKHIRNKPNVKFIYSKILFLINHDAYGCHFIWTGCIMYFDTHISHVLAEKSAILLHKCINVFTVLPSNYNVI